MIFITSQQTQTYFQHIASLHRTVAERATQLEKYITLQKKTILHYELI